MSRYRRHPWAVCTVRIGGSSQSVGERPPQGVVEWTYLACVALALVEAVIVVSGHVPFTTHHVVDVVAQPRRVGTVLARTNAELVERDEVLRGTAGLEHFETGMSMCEKTHRPLVELLQLAERAREDETANWIACGRPSRQ